MSAGNGTQDQVQQVFLIAGSSLQPCILAHLLAHHSVIHGADFRTNQQMNTQNVVYIHTAEYHKTIEEFSVICSNIEGTRGYLQ